MGLDKLIGESLGAHLAEHRLEVKMQLIAELFQFMAGGFGQLAGIEFFKELVQGFAHAGEQRDEGGQVGRSLQAQGG